MRRNEWSRSSECTFWSQIAVAIENEPPMNPLGQYFHPLPQEPLLNIRDPLNSALGQIERWFEENASVGQGRFLQGQCIVFRSDKDARSVGIKST